MYMFNKKEAKDEYFLYKIYSNSLGKFISATRRKGAITPANESESYLIPEKCRPFYVTRGFFRQKVFPCFFCLHGFPNVLDANQIFKGIKDLKIDYKPEDIKSMLESNVFSDFMKFKSGLNWLLTIAILLGGFLMGFVINIVLRMMGMPV